MNRCGSGSRSSKKVLEAEAEAEAISFKKLEAEVEVEALHAEAEAEAIKNSPLPHHCLLRCNNTMPYEDFSVGRSTGPSVRNAITLWLVRLTIKRN